MPKAAVSRCSKNPLLNSLVGAGEQRLWNFASCAICRLGAGVPMWASRYLGRGLLEAWCVVVSRIKKVATRKAVS